MPMAGRPSGLGLLAIKLFGLACGFIRHLRGHIVQAGFDYCHWRNLRFPNVKSILKNKHENVLLYFHSTNVNTFKILINVQNIQCFLDF